MRKPCPTLLLKLHSNLISMAPMRGASQPVTAVKVTMLFPSWASGSKQAPDSCVLEWKSQSPPAALTVTPATARVNAGYMVLFSEQEELSAYHFIKYNILCLLMF